MSSATQKKKKESYHVVLDKSIEHQRRGHRIRDVGPAANADEHGLRALLDERLVARKCARTDTDGGRIATIDLRVCACVSLSVSVSLYVYVRV